jgi:hypothetical protein
MLGIAVEKVCDLITHVRAFDAKIEATEADFDSNPAEEEMAEGLENYRNDPAYEELMGFIDSLNEEEQVNLVALAWLGRGDFVADEWADALRAASDARSDHTDTYLLGIPQLGDYLEEGLSALGYSCGD